MVRRWWVLVLPVMIAACAQVRDLTGGDKDTQGPQLVAAEPAQLSTNFRGDRIALRFDERVKLERVRERLLISPPLETPPDVRISGARDVVIELKAPLKENTTYSFAIGEAVQDLAEGNPAAGLTYVVSTGDVVDSLMITGVVTDAFKGTGEKDVLVLVYPANDTIAFRTGRPDYATRTDSAGTFVLRHLRPGQYAVRALRDQNANYRYDLPNEEIAFANEPVEASMLDTLTRPTELRLFREASPVQQVREARVTADGALRMVLARPTQELSLRDISRTGGTLSWSIEWNTTRDSLLIWPSDTTALKDGNYEVRTEAGILDTVRYRPVQPMPFFVSLRSATQEVAGATVTTLVASRPLATIDPSLFSLLRDSTRTAVSVSQDSTDKRLLRLNTDLPPGSSAVLTALPKAVRDIYGGHNDTLRIGIGRAAEKSTGTLRVRLDVPPRLGDLILQLLDQQGRVVHEKAISDPATPVVWDHLLPGNHTLRLIQDLNGNGRWDPGALRTGLQPESVWRYPETVNVRAAWDLGVDWKLR